MYIHMYIIVRNNLLLWFLSCLVVRSLRMLTSWNMYEPDKVKRILVQYVHLLVLRDCNHSQSTEIAIQKWQKKRSSPSIHICIHKTTKVVLKKKLGTHFGPNQFSIISIKHSGSSLKKHCPFLSKSLHHTKKSIAQYRNKMATYLCIYLHPFCHI
jgi:hypothetical protein